MNRNRHGSRAGFTLPEVLAASSISTLVAAGVLVTFIWCGQQASLSSKIAWSQNEAMSTSSRLTAYIRNAREVVSIDTNYGTWVQLRFADGATARLVYSNDMPELRDGRMYIQRTNGTQAIVARGLTEIQDSDGFYTPGRNPGFMFSITRNNALRVAYRVSEPAASGGRDANDGPYAAAVRFEACLRNAEE
jgi:prepilin-type N-terminal cleavage/methylation domain-containing protein